MMMMKSSSKRGSNQGHGVGGSIFGALRFVVVMSASMMMLLLISSTTLNPVSACDSHHDHSHQHTAHQEQRRLTDSDDREPLCGTSSMSMRRQLEVIEEVNEFRRQRKQRNLQNSGPYTIKVRFVHFKANGNEPDYPQADITANLATLNKHFADSNAPFTFKFDEKVEVVNANFVTCERNDKEKHEKMGAAHRTGNVRSMNVFLCKVSDGQMTGFAYYPYTYPFNLNIDNVFVNPNSIRGGGTTLSHEIGHWFGLLHTFENGCAFPGDGISDTPYQLEVRNSDLANCATPSDTCTTRDGTDAIDNIMGYTYNCASTFTPGQVELMTVVYEKYRDVQKENPDFCYMDVFIDFNGNPGSIIVDLAVDNIYLQDIKGSDYTPNESAVIQAVLDVGKASISVGDATGNGFPGGSVRLEVLQGAKDNAARTTAAEIKGDGSWTWRTTVDFVLPSNCIVTKQTVPANPAPPVPKPTKAPVPAPKPTKAPVPAPKPTKAPVPAPTPQAPVPKPTKPPVPAPKPTKAPTSDKQPTTKAPTTNKAPTNGDAEATKSPTGNNKKDRPTKAPSSAKNSDPSPQPTEPPSTPAPGATATQSETSDAVSVFRSIAFLHAVGLVALHVAFIFVA